MGAGGAVSLLRAGDGAQSQGQGDRAGLWVVQLGLSYPSPAADHWVTWNKYLNVPHL